MVPTRRGYDARMRAATRRDWERRADRAVESLAAGLDEPPRLEAAAAEAAASPWHFHRRFRELTGEAFASCLRRLRLERAAGRLREGRSVIEVALEAGFGSPEAFSRAFSAAFQLPPSRVAALPHWHGELASPNSLHFRPREAPVWHSPPAQGEDMETRICEFEPRRAFGFSGEGDPWGLPALWKRIADLPCKGGGAARSLSLFLPGGRFAAAWFASPGEELPPGAEEYALPGGTYAVTPFFGPCEGIGPRWDQWRATWLPTGGWELDPGRPSLEWYQSDASLAPPEISVTLLCDPVRRSR